MSRDPKTGFPEVPKGQYWRVVYREGGWGPYYSISLQGYTSWPHAAPQGSVMIKGWKSRADLEHDLYEQAEGVLYQLKQVEERGNLEGSYPPNKLGGK